MNNHDKAAVEAAEKQFLLSDGTGSILDYQRRDAALWGIRWREENPKHCGLCTPSKPCNMDGCLDEMKLKNLDERWGELMAAIDLITSAIGSKLAQAMKNRIKELRSDVDCVKFARSEREAIKVKLREVRGAASWIIKVFSGRADGMGEVAAIENLERAVEILDELLGDSK